MGWVNRTDKIQRQILVSALRNIGNGTLAQIEMLLCMNNFSFNYSSIECSTAIIPF